MQDANMIGAGLRYTEISSRAVRQIGTMEGPNVELIRKALDYLQAAAIRTRIDKYDLDPRLPLIDDGLECGCQPTLPVAARGNYRKPRLLHCRAVNYQYYL